MKVIAISDTHGLHHQLEIPSGDILVHAGDISLLGTLEQVKDFLEWFAKQPHPYKVFIAGNHDFYFEENSFQQIQTIIPKGVIYLNEELIEINGLRIWGSPITPIAEIARRRWAFIRKRGADIQQHWDLIPDNLDILIVHGPVNKTLDKVLKGAHVGCQNLLNMVLEKKPKLFISGHIHESRGIKNTADTIFVNASSVDRYKTKIFPPFTFDYQEGSFKIPKENEHIS